jgi:hypothetical protein
MRGKHGQLGMLVEAAPLQSIPRSLRVLKVTLPTWDVCGASQAILEGAHGRALVGVLACSLEMSAAAALGVLLIDLS